MKTKLLAGLFAFGVMSAGVLSQEELPRFSGLLAAEEILVFRGEAQLVGGQATITLPSYFESYTADSSRTVQLTCKAGWSPLWGSAVTSGRFTVSTNDSGNASQTFWWLVMAPRKD